MNRLIIKTVPVGEFEEVDTQNPEWQRHLFENVLAGKRITYNLFQMPNIPDLVEKELNKKSYVDCILESDNWQHFLVPSPVAARNSGHENEIPVSEKTRLVKESR